MLEWSEWMEVNGLHLRLVVTSTALRQICFADAGTPAHAGHDDGSLPAVLADTARQLREYFEGTRCDFSIPLDPVGTGFQQRVWRALLTIPYGETRTYREIAGLIESPAAVRAVGSANGSNPIPILIPCHRVIGSNGKLVGYGGGLPLKRRLLDLERNSGHTLWDNFQPSLSGR